MERITATLGEKGYNLAIQVNDAAGSEKDCSTFTTHDLQVWTPGTDPDDEDNRLIDDSLTWDDANTGAALYSIADGDLSLSGVYEARVYLAKTGVIEYYGPFILIIPDRTLYCTLIEIKSELDIDTSEYDDWLHQMCESATELIDHYCHTSFRATTATKYFDGADQRLSINDLISLTTLKLDLDCDGVFEATLTEGKDFNLEPYNQTPKRWVVISSRTDRSYHELNPGVRKGIEIAGSWGFQESIPELVRRAALIQVAEWKALNESGYTGITGSPEIGGSRIVGKTLSTRVRKMLDNFKRRDFY